MAMGDPYEKALRQRNAGGVYATQSAAQVGNFSNVLTDPLRNFKFLVKIFHQPRGYSDAFTANIGFMSVSGLAATTESIPYREGGMNTTVHQLPGQTSFSPVTMQRGVTIGQGGPWDWFRQIFAVIHGSGNGPANHAGGNNFRAGVDIDILDHPVTDLEGDAGGDQVTPVKLRLHLFNAWITGISFSDLNAGDNAVLVEQMTLVHEGFNVKYAPQLEYASAGPGDRVGVVSGNV